MIDVPVVPMYCFDIDDIYLDSIYHCRYQGLSGDIWKNNFKVQGEDFSQQDLIARMIYSKDYGVSKLHRGLSV